MRVSTLAPSSFVPAEETSPSASVEDLENFTEKALGVKRGCVPENLSYHPYRESLIQEKNAFTPKELYFEDLVVPEQDNAHLDQDRCGIWCFKPDFLQRFKNMKAFLCVFIIVGICQGMHSAKNLVNILLNCV